MKRKTKQKYWKESKNVKLRVYRDNQFDTLTFYWGGKYKHSREIKANLLLDFDDKGNILGIEIYDFRHALIESQKRIDELFKKAKNHEKTKRKVTR